MSTVRSKDSTATISVSLMRWLWPGFNRTIRFSGTPQLAQVSPHIFGPTKMASVFFTAAAATNSQM